MLEIQNIHKTFHKGTINEKKALDGVNLRLDPGDFVTIIGGNGAGKSTTLNAIAGTWVCGRRKDHHRRRRISPTCRNTGGRPTWGGCSRIP